MGLIRRIADERNAIAWDEATAIHVVPFHEDPDSSASRPCGPDEADAWSVVVETPAGPDELAAWTGRDEAVEDARLAAAVRKVPFREADVPGEDPGEDEAPDVEAA